MLYNVLLAKRSDMTEPTFLERYPFVCNIKSVYQVHMYTHCLKKPHSFFKNSHPLFYQEGQNLVAVENQGSIFLVCCM